MRADENAPPSRPTPKGCREGAATDTRGACAPQTIAKIDAVAAAAREVRRACAGALQHLKGGLRALHRTVELPGANPLKDAHAALDAAVLAPWSSTGGGTRLLPWNPVANAVRDLLPSWKPDPNAVGDTLPSWKLGPNGVGTPLPPWKPGLNAVSVRLPPWKFGSDAVLEGLPPWKPGLNAVLDRLPPWKSTQNAVPAPLPSWKLHFLGLKTGSDGGYPFKMSDLEQFQENYRHPGTGAPAQFPKEFILNSAFSLSADGTDFRRSKEIIPV